MGWENDKHIIQVTMNNQLFKKIAHYAIEKDYSRHGAILEILEHFFKEQEKSNDRN